MIKVTGFDYGMKYKCYKCKHKKEIGCRYTESTHSVDTCEHFKEGRKIGEK